MSVLVIPLPPFPNVPKVLGVPPVPRSITFPTPDVIGPLGPDINSPVLTADSPSVLAAGRRTGAADNRQWGIFDGANQVIAADSVLAVEYRSEERIVDYPIEQGGFESYNKVKVPYEVRVTMTRGGTDADRTAFLNGLETILKALTLYTVVTPEKTYANANVQHIDYRREQRHGATLITADIWLAEVRVAAAPAFSAVQQPSDASTLQGGTVQAQPPTPAQAAAGADALAHGPPQE